MDCSLLQVCECDSNARTGKILSETLISFRVFGRKENNLLQQNFLRSVLANQKFNSSFVFFSRYVFYEGRLYKIQDSDV